MVIIEARIATSEEFLDQPIGAWAADPMADGAGAFTEDLGTPGAHPFQILSFDYRI